MAASVQAKRYVFWIFKYASDSLLRLQIITWKLILFLSYYKSQFFSIVYKKTDEWHMTTSENE